jgi:hypothetical protein
MATPIRNIRLVSFAKISGENEKMSRDQIKYSELQNFGVQPNSVAFSVRKT